MGRDRKRLMTPVLRSVLSPTAVPMAEVVRFRAKQPGQGEVDVLPSAGHGTPEPNT